MNAGYVRLSRDDNKKNYISIENQKLLITQYAKEQGHTIDRWYEDDGISGYLFERPGFQQMMEALKKDIDTVYVKDFSRLGRHNAKVLLLLDEFQEQGKRLIVIDDHYDSFTVEDDTIGIKTWYNERYVKDISRKIKGAIHARQKEGTLLVHPPFGYRKNPKDNTLEIIPREAEWIKYVYASYQKGDGYRKIAEKLNQKGVPTPSMLQQQQNPQYRRRISVVWSDSMVRNLLNNDFYIGTLRLHKRERKVVHGKDYKIEKNKQYIFENHHVAIIKKEEYDQVQKIKKKRREEHDWRNPQKTTSNPYYNYLFCKDCGSHMTPIRRKNSTYYICSRYNSKGKRYCHASHSIKESNLRNEINTIWKQYQENKPVQKMEQFIQKEPKENQESEKKIKKIEKEIKERKKQLQVLMHYIITDAIESSNKKIIMESYETIKKEILAEIQKDEIKITEIKEQSNQNSICEQNHAINTANSELSREQLENIIERIEIDEKGRPEIRLKY